MSEQDERMTARGPRGPQGNQGNRGEKGRAGVPGLSRAVRRALVFMFVLNLAMAGANFLWTAHSVKTNSQQRCSSLAEVVQIPVPQPVAGNPSRMFDARLEAIYRQRLRQLHCAGG